MKIRPGAYASMFRAYLYLTCAFVMVTIFLTTIIQGVLIHFQGQVVYAAVAYFFSWVSLGTAVITFLKGKELLEYVKLAT